MARISSPRRSNAFPGIAALTALVMLGGLGLAGCGGNDHPADSGGTMKVDLRELTNQMGGGFQTQAAGVDDSPATTAVKSMIIGAVVITFTDAPLSSDTKVDSDLSDKLATDVINSINYFSIVDLPTSQDFVEFKVPPPGASHWQVAAIGTKNQIVTFEDLNDNNVAIYYGFDENFHTTSGNSTPDVTLEMKRACFIDIPPKGCAAYSDGGKIVITSSVTILDILTNGSSVGTGLGGYTFGTAITSQTQADSVESQINGALSPASGSGAVTVVVTHPDAPGQSACSTVTHANYSSRPECTGTFVTKY